VVHIASGATRDKLSKAMFAAEAEGRFTPDIPFSYDDLYGVYKERAQAQGAAYLQAAGISREDPDRRRRGILRNLDFFGAPHVCLLFIPPVYETARAAGDVGMYGQTFLLSLAAHGLGGVPQTMLSLFAADVREILGVEPSLKMLFGISFGYPNPGSPMNTYRLEKAVAFGSGCTTTKARPSSSWATEPCAALRRSRRTTWRCVASLAC
jgi:nitroreductase